MALKDVAEKANTSVQQVQRLERGERRLTTDWIERLSDALNCQPSDIVPNLQPAIDPWAQDHLDALKGFDEAERKHYDEGMRFLFPEKFKKD